MMKFEWDETKASSNLALGEIEWVARCCRSGLARDGCNVATEGKPNPLNLSHPPFSSG